MKVMTLASLRGAPGVTTTALLLASTFTDAVVVEADLDGGVLAVRYGLGREPGLTTFAASAGEDGHDWRAHAQDAGGVPVLVGPDASAASASLWRTAGERITHKLVAADGVAVVDAGRLRSLAPVVTASDLLAVLVCPIAEQLVALTHLLPTLHQTIRGQIAVVLVGDGPYRAADVEGPLDVTVLGELPDDRDAADALRNGTASRTRLARSRLARAVAALGAEVRTAVLDSVEVAAS
jgi:MinD-like ATPase involved in chromosome partitioning or flagellar assembly